MFQMTHTRHTFYVIFGTERRNSEFHRRYTNFTLWIPAFINSLDSGVVNVQDGREATIPLLR